MSTITAKTTDISDVINILILELDRFPVINWLIDERHITPTVLLLPQTLKDISELISVRSDVLIECVDFLDILSILRQNPELNKKDLFNSIEVKPVEPNGDIDAIEVI